ncbi:YceI family protein [Streptomyces sp. NPDC056656]|uniref:YceI family protein n=1 Tax=Streptomyces sp. NPDC056656 TaxID=3345895 RepID=UPI0036C21E07
MFGLTMSKRSRAVGRSGRARVPVPLSAGILSGRVTDPIDEPLTQADFTVTDLQGRHIVRGTTDPFGSFVVTLPAGDYRLSAGYPGFAPHRCDARVAPDQVTYCGDITLQPAGAQQTPPPGAWEIEQWDSQISFTALHIGLARVRGQFTRFAGALDIGERIEDSAMHVVMDAASIDTGVKMRDDHLRSPDFLDTEAFPTLEFYSDKFVRRSGNMWAVTGGLTLHGVTRTVTLETEYLGLGTGLRGDTRAACRATTELHRDDFTVSWQKMLARGIAFVGPRVQVDLDIQIVPKQS